jgi:hypothetical protein
VQAEPGLKAVRQGIAITSFFALSDSMRAGLTAQPFFFALAH